MITRENNIILTTFGQRYPPKKFVLKLADDLGEQNDDYYTYNLHLEVPAKRKKERKARKIIPT